MTIKEYNICVDNFSDGLYRFILKNIKDSDNAKDIIQDSFLKLWQKVDEINFEKAKSYLFTSAYNTMIDYLRKNKNYSIDNEFSIVEEKTEISNNWELKEVIDFALKKLTDIQRHVILLRDYEGYSYKEIGEITGLNESQVKIHIFRSRKFLKEIIESLEIAV